MAVRRLRAGHRPLRTPPRRPDDPGGAAGLRRPDPPGQQPRPVRHQGRTVRHGVGRPVRRRGGADEPDQGGAARAGGRRRVAALHPDRPRPRIPIRRHPGRRRPTTARGARTCAAATSAHRVLPGGRRRAVGVRGRRGGAAAGARRELDDPPGLRHRESRLAALGPRPGRQPHVHPLRRARAAVYPIGKQTISRSTTG